MPGITVSGIPFTPGVRLRAALQYWQPLPRMTRLESAGVMEAVKGWNVKV